MADKKSVWMDHGDVPEFPTLNEDMKTDVLIIGGGLAGVLCAYFLEESGVKYILAEREKICTHTTGNTTAKITAQHGLIYDKLIRQYGVRRAKLYLEANEAAIRKYRELCADIPCDYEEKSAYVYSFEDTHKLQKEIEALHQLGYNAFLKKSVPLPFDIAGAVEFKNQAQFNPVQFINGISRGLNIYENTFVTKIEDHTAYTDRGKITADKIIVATHFPFMNTHGFYFLKLYQQRSYVIALEDGPDVEGMYIRDEKNGLSFRNYKNLLLIGGGGHRTGKKGGNWAELNRFAKKHYASLKIVNQWATQDCMSLDGIPYIGQYARHTPDWYVATGFNKWGMTSSMVSAMLLRDLVLGKKNKYSALYDPSRNILKPQLAVNSAAAVVNLLTPTAPRCPHLGCALKWNEAEHTWDCPCHGSRFEKDGKMLDNPANGNAKFGR